MRLVEKFNDVNKAYDLKNLLESHGIPSNVNENSQANRGAHIPEGNEVWIYINTQYSDAVKLYKNRNHIVKEQVDINEFYKKINSKEYHDLLIQYKSKFILYGLTFVATMVIVVTYLLFELNAKT